MYHRFESRDPNWNLLGGSLAILGGVAFLVWPQLALALLAGTLGFNLFFLGGHLVTTGWKQMQIGQGTRVEQIYRESPQANPWVGASQRQRRETQRSRDGRGPTLWSSSSFFGNWS